MNLAQGLEAWGPALLAAGLGALLAWVAHRVLRPLALRLGSRTVLLASVLRRIDAPLAWLLPVLALQLVWQGVDDALRGIGAVRHASALALIAACTWTLAAAVRGVAEGVIALHPVDVADNLAARRVNTQTRVLGRIAVGVIITIGLSFMLMSFPEARQVGASILASAGVVGLVAGIAARSVFSNLLAGLQIAMAQPIRIDDVLIVEGEWGRVEEISATYVVLRIWDERRLIIPLQWFIEHPFQNWTRRDAALLGTVMLWLDFGTPLAALRTEALRLCERDPNWDRRVCVVQVTETSERAMQVRVLVSAASSGACFDLRCAVREGLIAFLHQHHPQALPRLRAELPREPAQALGT
ncbi:mechanosensitive ion channel family protein [Aquabacterium sp.]|uniref:mechanosensitive ion channel family protein n=1 Tax=Aquabacterium sp. TaxID=1872578 RepID=UPI0037845FB3